MAIQVVDRLEIIQIEHQQGEPGTVSLGLGNDALQVPVVALTVIE